MKEFYRVQEMGPKGLTLIVSISLERGLTDDESWMLSESMDNLRKAIHNTNLKNDAQYQLELKKEKEDLLACFGTNPIHVKEIPNEYAGTLNPWFIVTTKKGPIKIGWRKRVINIDWLSSDITEEGKRIFPERTTTLGENYLHANNYEDATNCINRLLKW